MGCGGYVEWDEDWFLVVESYVGGQAWMAERDLQIQKYTPFKVGGAKEHCILGESRFVTLPVHPYKMRTPSANVAFGVTRKLSTRRSRGRLHHHTSRKVTPASTQQQSIQEKNGGNLPCNKVRLQNQRSHGICSHWRRSVKSWQVNGCIGCILQAGNP